MAIFVMATVTDNLTDEEYKVRDVVETSEEVKNFLARIEKLFVFEAAYVGAVSIKFLVDFGDGEIDGFTRYYYGGRHVETV